MSYHLVNAISQSKVASTLLRCTAGALLFVYLGWNAYWLSQQTIPPSLFVALTGLPCPTTGGTRAVCCLLEGNVRESLQFNAMAVPLSAMFFVTCAVAAFRFRYQGAISLPNWIVPAWVIVLLMAWLIRLAASSNYW